LLRHPEMPAQNIVRYSLLQLIPDFALVCAAQSERSNELVLFDPLQGVIEVRLSIPTLRGEADSLKALALSGDQTKLFAATRSGLIYRVDWADQKLSRICKTHETLEQLRVAHWRERIIGFTTGRGDRRNYSARIWDLETGEELFSNRNFALRYGQQDKTLYALAVAELDDNVRFAFAGEYGKIMVANLVAEPGGHYPVDFDEWQLPFPTSGYTKCLTVGNTGLTKLLAAGTEDGEIAILDFFSGECQAAKRDVHRGYIHSLAMRRLNGTVVLLSGGADGSVAFWSAELEPLGRIEMGEEVYSAIWISDVAIAVGTARGLVAIQLLPVLLKSSAAN
jgi:WD40 repeat protein